MQHHVYFLYRKVYINCNSYAIMAKIVLTGGPSSGKTSLIEELSSMGHSVIPEVAKDLILKIGNLDPRDKVSYAKFQEDVALEQIRREEELYKGQITFLDRGLYDGIAYSQKYLGFVPEALSASARNHSGYERIFVLDRLPFVKENFRIENGEAEAAELHHRIVKVYSNYYKNLERVPVLPIKDRLNYVLEKLK